MLNIQVVSREQHASKRWQRYTSYAFAAADAVAQLVLQELPKACTALPVGFVLVKGQLQPVAVLGLEPGKNLLVGADGSWRADYIPAVYRSYPFTLAKTPDGKPVLCVIEDSGLLSDTVGEPFFDDTGEPAQAVQQVLGFMKEVAASHQTARRICAVLQKHKLVQPWPLRRRTEAGEHVLEVEGLHCIDDAALRRLPDAAFLEVRQAGALPMIYCHLLSKQHLHKLEQLAQTQAAIDADLSVGSDGNLDLEFLNSDTIGFGSL